MHKINRLSILALAMSISVFFCSCGSNGNSNTSAISATDGNEAVAILENEDEKPEEKEDMSEAVSVKDLPILYKSVENETGAFLGCAATGMELDDEKVWEIVTTHFNAITFGNELKPDALFNYSNGKCPGTSTVVFNGEEMTVPNLDYSRAERMLNKIYDWNQDNPDRKIMVRGHVLVWHSQTPEWWFHEDYDKTKPYVDKDTMNKRLEWYIATVLTHFTGEDSKYKDMFYGWDVVNEAISDATNDLRTDKENPGESLSQDTHGSNSSWYAVYGSDEFIINAFKYANKYAPEDLELYYNDYNECNISKRTGIVKLLTEIKEAEGEPGVGTRISAMGMQGHYGMDNPDASTIESSIRTYCNAVGKVQITEFDISASSDYKGDASQKEEENEKLRKRYNMIYFYIKSAINSGCNVEGITFWGTVDHYSWLQSRSNVGGGNKSGLPQMPLLFDENYEAKPCFYVFARDEK